LFVDSRYAEIAATGVRDNISVRSIETLEQELKNIKECGMESDDVTVQRLAIWKKKFSNTKFVPKSGIVGSFRRQKDDYELLQIKRAEKITRELLRRVPGALRTTTTEEKLARQLNIWALELGAEGLAFHPIVAFGTHTSRPHHQPTNRVLKPGHLVQIDVGAKVNGYCSDASEVFFTAKPTKLQKKIYETLREAQNASLKLLKQGVTTKELDLAARAILEEEGIDDAFTHALGHGVGLDVHEGPTISAKVSPLGLHRHEVVTIEPGVYFEGKFGMRLESIGIVQ
jgi:Xaa-Pro aminopeptidase